MIKTLALEAQAFAAEREPVLLDAIERLRPGVEAGLASGGDDWNLLLTRMHEVYADAWQAESDEPVGGFPEAIELLDSLERTIVRDDRQAQVERIATWLATATVAAASVQVAASERGMGVQWFTMGDDRVREMHADAHGQTRRAGQPFDIGGNPLQYPGQPVGPPEAWINCVVGSTRVAWPGQDVLAVTRYVASGDFIDVRTVDGHHLTLTPNHPVLTPTGYVPAGRLRPGDQVMAAPLPEAPEVADAPPSIEQAYEAARMTGHVQRVGRGGVDFHGDVPQDEVEVVWTDGDLAAQLRVQGGDRLLVGAGVGQGALGVRGPSQLPGHEGVARHGAPSAPRGVRGGGQGSPFSGGEPSQTQPVRLAAVTDGQAEVGHAPQDDVAGDAEVARHLQHALALGVAPSEVIEVQRYRARHPVYNLHTTENYYMCNGIVTHNCRCTLRVVEVADALVAAADTPTSAVIAAVPAKTDPVWKVSGDGDPHVTLAYFGEADGLDIDPIRRVLAAAATSLDVFTEPVMGRGVLGSDEADVALIEAKVLAPLREALAADPVIAAGLARVEQFPAWIPHLTLGYPAKPAKGEAPEAITFDSLELWVGPDRHRYTLGSQENIPTEAAMTITQDAVETDDAPQIPDEDLHLPVPWYGVLAPEGVWSGDKRRFAQDALRHRDLPLPLKWMPADAEGHRGSVVVGRIDRAWRVGNEIRAEGVFDSSPQAYEAVRLIAEQMIRGVSVDVDDAEGQMSAEDDPEGGLTFSSARISAATLCAIPAFAEAFVALGFWSDVEEDGVLVDDEGNEYALLDDEEFIAIWRPKAPKTKLAPWSKSKMKRVERKHNNPRSRRWAKRPPIIRASSEWDGSPVFTDDSGQEYLLVELAISEKDWDGSASRFSNEEWKRSCILHVCDGDEKSCHKLPIKEPDGTLSRRGVHAAASRLNQVDAPPDKVAAAKRALAAAYRQLGEEAPFTAETAEFDIPPAKTKDAPGWITHPRPTREITAYWVDGPGAAKIGWGAPGDFNRCRAQLGKYVRNPEWLAGLCANLHYRALRIWPGEHRGEAALAASVGTPPKAWFENPNLTEPTPLTITDDGRVFGHVALWNTCHIGRSGCVTAPRSTPGYPLFHTGQIFTDAGPVNVGQITLGGGHADLRLSARGAKEHYDTTSAAVADIVVGDDVYGIWFSGALRPGLTQEDVRTLRAASVSGDWRPVRDHSEMVAVLAVNVPGFPIPRPSVLVYSNQSYVLTAAGIVTDENAAAMLAELADTARRSLKVERARRALKEASK